MTILTDKKRGSSLEQLFIYYWEADRYTKDLVLYQDVRFLKKRRFRIDFLHKETRVGIEIQGGTYTFGRHSRGPALEAEYEKLNLATLLGYKVFLLTKKMIQRDYLIIGAFIKYRLAGTQGEFLDFLKREEIDKKLIFDPLPSLAPF